MAPPSRSAVWDYFEKAERDGKKHSKCKMCGFEKSGWLASNNKVHLATHGITLNDEKPLTEAQELELETAKAVEEVRKERGLNPQALTNGQADTALV